MKKGDFYDSLILFRSFKLLAGFTSITARRMVVMAFMKVGLLTFSKTIIIKDRIEELSQYVTDKSFKDTIQIILQSLPIKHWPSIETESRPFVVKTG